MNVQNTKAAKLVILTVLLLGQTYGLLAQDCTTCQGSNTLSLTTGLTTSGTLMPMPIPANGGVPDPYWQLINVAPPSVNGPNVGPPPYTISIPNAYTIWFGAKAWSSNWVNIPGAQALSVIPNHAFPTNNTVANQPWRFLRKFSLCQNASVHFVVDHIGDDQSILKIFDSTGTLLATHVNTAGWKAPDSFDETLEMHAGCCYLVDELVNTGGSLMGFSVKANLSVPNNSLSNPNEVCCATSVISGQKILDANCNGKFDAGDSAGVGWTINLLSGSSVVQTATTDSNGEFTFYNVPNGSYTLQEVMQSGYAAGNPSSGQYTVTVSAPNTVQTFQFFNCKGPPISPTPSPSPSPSPTPTPTPTPTPIGCAEVVGEPRCLSSGSYSYTLNVKNNSGSSGSQILLTPAQGSSFTLSPQLANLSSPLNNGQSTSITTTISNAKPGDKVCFFVSLMSEETQCCIVEVCLTMPQCGEVSPTPTVASSSSPTLRQQPPVIRQQPRGRRRP